MPTRISSVSSVPFSFSYKIEYGFIFHYVCTNYSKNLFIIGLITSFGLGLFK